MNRVKPVMTAAECLRLLKYERRVKFSRQNFDKHVLRGVIPHSIDSKGRKRFMYVKVVDALWVAGLHELEDWKEFK